MSFKVRRKKHHDLREIKAAQVKVGFPSGSAQTDEEGASVISIAIWNHYGTNNEDGGVHIPERPFLSNAIRDNSAKYRAAMKTSAAKILRGETEVRAVMSKLGILAQGHIQKEITNLKDPPNAESTIAHKGSSNPLIDNGVMRSSVTYKVEDK